jgi:hypothetical protein
MRAVAREFNQSETTFVLPPTRPGATWRVALVHAGRRRGCGAPATTCWARGGGSPRPGGSNSTPDGPLPVWRRWASDVHSSALPGGHFIPEEAGDELATSLHSFVQPAAAQARTPDLPSDPWTPAR